MSSMTLFGGKSSALLAGIKDSLLDTIAGSGGSTNRRLSIKGGVFRQIINGKEHTVSEERAMNVVLVNAAPLSRMFYEGSYAEGVTATPLCWSSDTQVPDEAVPQEQRQASRCMDCKQNIKGSGQGDSRACRFSQRLAVQLEGEIEKREVYQLSLPATSIFGSGEKNKLPLQAYGRYLKDHNEPPIGVVTEMRFDTASPTPKLVFKPVRRLEEDELAAALEMREHADTIKAITLHVGQMDSGEKDEGPLFDTPPAKAEEPAPKAATKPAAKAEAPKAEAPAEEPVEEPKKMAKKTAAAAPSEEKADLASIVGDWDD